MSGLYYDWKLSHLVNEKLPWRIILKTKWKVNWKLGIESGWVIHWIDILLKFIVLSINDLHHTFPYYISKISHTKMSVWNTKKILILNSNQTCLFILKFPSSTNAFFLLDIIIEFFKLRHVGNKVILTIKSFP